MSNLLLLTLLATVLSQSVRGDHHHHGEAVDPIQQNLLNQVIQINGNASGQENHPTPVPAHTDEDEERLVIDMFKDYNRLIRPAKNANSSAVVVEFGLSLILLINVDEKNQIMQSSVWLTLKWNDCQFDWDPADFGGIESMRVPEDRVWVPDIVLFNNADGNYEVSYHSNVVVDYQGNVMWVPPAIYKSSCRIDVEYFPFDEQTCVLVFGSWTYNSNEVKLNWYNNKRFVELNDYSYSGIWDVIDVPCQIVHNSSKIEFQIVIRRKTLFYTVILIIPTVLMAFLSMMVFYLPAECSEKITLSISILLALVVFLLLVSKILPPTSDTIPLMAKYLLLTFILNIVTIMVTVIIINVYFRSASTHHMPVLVRTIFLDFLPQILMIKRPERIPIFNGYFMEEYCAEEIIDASLVLPSMTATILPFMQVGVTNPMNLARSRTPAPKVSRFKQISRRFTTSMKKNSKTDIRIEAARLADDMGDASPKAATRRLFTPEMQPSPSNSTYASEPPQSLAERHRISHELMATVHSIAYIANHMKAEMNDKKIRDDWKYIAMVIDRLLLVIFFGITLGGTVGIILSAPHVFDFVDQEEVIKKLIASNEQEQALQNMLNSYVFSVALASDDEERLIIDIFRGYNHLVRPVQNVSTTSVEVAFSLAMVLLINVDEKNQIMQTNVWPTMKWVDYQMRWDPRAYGNIHTIRVPPDKVWLPDIVLFNNADGNYEVSFYSNVVVEHTGEMLWVPPAIYKSSCTIDVEFFPFDEQICAMIFGSWTFNENEVTIKYLMGKRQVELNDYSPSGIWDVMEVPGELIQKKSKIAYQIRIRRKTLFYTVILIIPTVLMAFLSMMVFYLPAEASEKITLAISILLALVVFLLLVSKILPPTSSTIPLMAKYLLMTFVMNIITILVTVIIINIYFRGPTTHTMPNWVKTIFLKHLPLLLMMRRPIAAEDLEGRRKKKKKTPGSPITAKYRPGEFIEMNHAKIHHPYCSLQRRRRPDDECITLNASASTSEEVDETKPKDISALLSEEAIKAIDAIDYITEHLKQDNYFKKVREEWKYVAMVIDRLLLYIFFAVTAGGTMGILFSAPNVFEYVNQTAIIEQLKKSAEAEMIS
ncbi:hypothetical protein QR680_003556 [Steinernema hermaphroditum]|uniref:Uncharacterized protein n=1 Tax=Steinernema hermaphroditum TaxID=289476 RepID=A0AA39LSH1_9BILA|nr:hypothetical protein QR680_003556 [Steinernema hermaphroditum]